MCKHLHSDWSQIPAKRTDIKPTAKLETPANRSLLGSPPQIVRISCYHNHRRQSLISIFSALYEWRIHTVKRGGHLQLHKEYISRVKEKID
jgi:hypothetical protein